MDQCGSNESTSNDILLVSIRVIGEQPTKRMLNALARDYWGTHIRFRIESITNKLRKFSFQFKVDFARPTKKSLAWMWWFGADKTWVQAAITREPLIEIVPLWVLLPDLHSKYWNIEALGRLASILGTPLHGDFIRIKGPNAMVKLCVVIDSNFRYPKEL